VDAGANNALHRRTTARRRNGPPRGLTLLEVVIGIALLAVLAWLFLPRPDPALKHNRRLACMNKLRDLHAGALAYAAANDGCFPLAWHVDGPAIADDLGNLLFARFAIHEHCDPGFSHVVSRQDVETSVGLLPARRQKYRLTAFYWKCPAKGWTDDYFAPEVVFRKSAAPARQAELAKAVPPVERPIFADVNASLPNPNAHHIQDPGHNHELRNGFSFTSESNVDVFIGVGPSLRAEGYASSSRFDFRHDGAVNVQFLDGHAEFITPAEKQRLERIYRAWDYADPGKKEK